jgi:hypothetical protein
VPVTSRVAGAILPEGMPLDPERVQVLLTLEKQRRIRFGAVMLLPFQRT